MENRTASQVAARWEKCLNPALVKGPFTAEEDRVITEYVRANGAYRWPVVCAKLGNRRSPKQCRERWFNQLDPNVHQNPWTAEEDRVVFESYNRLGPKWSLIAAELPGRPDNAVKNRWNSSIRKRIQAEPGGGRALLPDQSPRRRRGLAAVTQQPIVQAPVKPPPPPRPPAVKTQAVVSVPISFGVAMNLPPVRTSGPAPQQAAHALQWLAYPATQPQGYFAPILLARPRPDDAPGAPEESKPQDGAKKDEALQDPPQFTGFPSPHVFSPHIFSPGVFSLYQVSSACSPFGAPSASGQNVFASSE
jgi:hypothetical protein